MAVKASVAIVFAVCSNAELSTLTNTSQRKGAIKCIAVPATSESTAS